MTKPPSKRTRMPAFPPISKEGYLAVCGYIDQALAHAKDPAAPKPNTDLLLLAQPQGSILEITADFAIRVGDTSVANGLRSPRYLDPEGLAVLRLLLLPGGSVGLNRKNMDRPNRRDYPHYRAIEDGADRKIPIARIIADTQPGYQTPFADNHLVLRRAEMPARRFHKSSRMLTLDGMPTKSPHLGRQDAIELAVQLLERNAHRIDFSITGPELRRRLEQALYLLDLRPLKGG